MEPISRRGLLRHLAAAAAAMPALASSASARAPAPPAQQFPVRTLTLWVPWPAGGATDLTLRILADGAARRLGQKVIIDNRPGAGGTLVMPVLQQAAADGYTLAQLPQPVLRTPWVQKVSWDPVRDTTPILQISGVTFGMVVPTGSALRSLDDVFDWAAAHPGEITVATNGVGTTPHLVLDELFARRGIAWTHVPYKGTAEQMVAVASGQVMVGVNSNGFAPYVDSGRLRLLVTFGEQRTRRWPQVPTLKELGHGIVATSPYGLVGPRGLAPEIVAVLHEAFHAAMYDSAHLVELERYDQELAYLGPQDYARAIRLAYAAEGRAVQRLGLVRGAG